MIKNRSDLLLGILWLMMAAMAFPDRNPPIGMPFHEYVWLIWLIGAAILCYRAFRVRSPVRKDPLTMIPEGRWYAISTALFILVFLTAPLWHEFHERGQPLWNGFLAIFLVSLVVGSFAGIRHLQKNRIQIGEARFDSSEGNDP